MNKIITQSVSNKLATKREKDMGQRYSIHSKKYPRPSFRFSNPFLTHFYLSFILMLWKRMPGLDIYSLPPFSHLVPLSSTPRTNEFHWYCLILVLITVHLDYCNSGIPWWLSGKESPLQECRRQSFDPWVRRIPWRRKRQPTLVFLPGESHGHRSLVGCSPWGCKELDVTERLKSNKLLLVKALTMALESPNSNTKESC